jgi:ribonuclease Z
LGGLLSTFARWESIDALEIYAGTWALNRIQDLIFGVVLRGAEPPMPIHLIDLKPGIFLEDPDYSVAAFPVQHRGRDCYGFVFQEKSRRPFLVDEAEALGVPVGPERARLVRGESIRLADGRTIQPDEVLGPDTPGARLVHTGDIAVLDGRLREIAQGAHCLVMEATYLEQEAEMAREYGHMTAGQAARFAQECGVGTLLLTHLSRRYRERDVVHEARRYFPNSYVVRDFDRFAIAKGRPVQKIEKALEPVELEGEVDAGGEE